MGHVEKEIGSYRVEDTSANFVATCNELNGQICVAIAFYMNHKSCGMSVLERT